MGLMEWDRQQEGRERGIRTDKSWRSFAIWLRGIFWNINYPKPHSRRECFDSWSSSSMKWAHYLFNGIHFSFNRERGRNYFFDSSETKTFSAGRAKSDKNIVLRLANEANTSTNEFQLFLIKVDVAEVKMTPVPQSSFSCFASEHERVEWQPIINASGVQRGKYFSSSIFLG